MVEVLRDFYNMAARLRGRNLKIVGLLIVSLGALWVGNDAFGSVFSDWEDEKAKGPPGLSMVFPPRDRGLARLQAVVVTFWEPVTGVSPNDLTVSGSPAAEVEESHRGRTYKFAGFATPVPGTVVIELRSGEIQDRDSLPFEGDSWTYTFFDPMEDDDGDGLNNEEEFEKGADPLKPDTDEDGLPDLYESAHSCLSPGWNETFIAVYLPPGGRVPGPPGSDDADNDGRSNLEEFTLGTDPCKAEDE